MDPVNAPINTNISVDAQPSGSPTTNNSLMTGWRYYKKFIKTGFDAVGLGDKIQDNGDDTEGTYHMGDVAAAIPILATIVTIGGVAARGRSKKSKTMKSMSDTFQSGLSTLKSLSFGRKRKSRRRSHKRSRVRKFGRRSRRSHKRKSRKR